MRTHAIHSLKKPYSSDYISNALKLFDDTLKDRGKQQLLDVGPVCGDNITFFASKFRRLYLCDMFFHLDWHRREGLPSSQAWHNLNYPSRSFDGILLWGLVDHLEDVEAARLVEMCYTMLRPRGLLMVIVQTLQSDSAVVTSFVVRDSFRLFLRPQPQLQLPFHGRHSREVINMFSHFTPLKSFIYNNGIREFLFMHR